MPVIFSVPTDIQHVLMHLRNMTDWSNPATPDDWVPEAKYGMHEHIEAAIAHMQAAWRMSIGWKE